MKLRSIAVLVLVAGWLILLSPPAAFADPPSKEAELLKRIEQLEKRVAELEKAIKERPSGKELATETEKKLAGKWVITDDDKKKAADKKIPTWTDLTMKADGTCAVVGSDGAVYPDAKYQVTVSGSVTQISIELKKITGGGGGSLSWGD